MTKKDKSLKKAALQANPVVAEFIDAAARGDASAVRKIAKSGKIEVDDGESSARAFREGWLVPARKKEMMGSTFFILKYIFRSHASRVGEKRKIHARNPECLEERIGEPRGRETVLWLRL